MLKKRKIPANRLFHFEIVRELYHDPIDIRKISQLLRSDAPQEIPLLIAEVRAERAIDLEETAVE